MFPHEPSCSSNVNPEEKDHSSSVLSKSPMRDPLLCQVTSTSTEEEKGEDSGVTCPPINECQVPRRPSPSFDATPKEKDPAIPVESNPKLAAVLTDLTMKLSRKSLINPKGRPKLSKRATRVGDEEEVSG